MTAPIVLMLEDNAERLESFHAAVSRLRADLIHVIVHTSNGARGEMMEGELELAGWERHRVPPLGDDWIGTDWFRLARRRLRLRR